MDCYGYIKENFHKLNGKIYRPQKNGNYLILALMKKDAKNVGKIGGKYLDSEIEKNDAIKKDLESYFHVSKGIELQEDLVIEDLPDVGTLEDDIFSHKDDLALLITKEGNNFEIAKKDIIETKKVGVALKMDGAVLQLVEGFTKARYLIIHNKKTYEAYEFDGKGPKLIPASAAEPMVVTKKDEDLYLVYQVDTNLHFKFGELDFSKAIKGGEGYNPQLLPLSKLIKV